MSFEMFREINMFIPLLAFGWLGYRIIHAWPADWAKPDHVWHYRLLLVIASMYVLLSSLGAIAHEIKGTPATWVSPAYTIQSMLVIALCWLWPKPRSRR